MFVLMKVKRALWTKQRFNAKGDGGCQVQSLAWKEVSQEQYNTYHTEPQFNVIYGSVTDNKCLKVW